MTVQVEFWQLLTFLVGLLLTFLGGVFAASKLVLKHFKESIEKIEKAVSNEAGHAERIEKELLRLRAELPVHYVMKNDYVRQQTIVEAKLDAIAAWVCVPGSDRRRTP